MRDCVFVWRTVNGLRIEAMISAANKVRATASTKCNEHSSRSHYIFRMRIEGRNARTGASTEGELNLVDLAGSERVKLSGAEGAVMKEAQAINKSLSSLGDVIAAMASKQQHVPYRNSKLTHLLQASLPGPG